jgi:hypothetical protein
MHQLLLLDQHNRASGKKCKTDADSIVTPLRVSALATHFSTALARVTVGGTDGEIRTSGFEERGISHAAPKARDAQERLGTESEEPQAGDSDSAERSPEKGGQGAPSSFAQVQQQEEVGQVAPSRARA